MASPLLIPAAVTLRSEFNKIAPNRDKKSDGWIGDAAHQAGISDHNDDEVGNVPIRDSDKDHEVHAIDVDVNLNESDLTMEKVVQHLLARCRLGLEKRLRYIIFNRRIWEASNGWKQRTYRGDSPHIEHAHFSFSYTTSLEASTASYRLEDIPVALTNDDKTWLAAQIDKAATAAAERVWKTRFNIEMGKNAVTGKPNPPYLAEAGSILAHVPFEHGTANQIAAEIKRKVGA